MKIAILWAVTAIICALLMIGGWHLLAPAKWHWLSDDQQVVIFLLAWISGFVFIAMGLD